MPELLDLVAHLPVVELDAGETLIAEDTRTGSVWVMTSGSVEVTKHGARINVNSRVGQAFGEVAVLTGSDHTASVVALEPSRFHFAEDGRALLLDHSELLLYIATGLAERLDIVTTYLADLRNQYSGTPGIDMVSNVLGRLVQPTEQPAPGSARDPDPEY